ncbi:MAG: T9SS type A sorting domain-containing protein, partial [Paludibacteraceae bacterium]|nr:T9SS type A sorting domain-containing protein [Paludibacteraceae bacterium]
GEEDDTYTLTMSYDVRVLENSESEDENFGMDAENSDLLPLSEYVLTRPNPVKTILYVRMTEPAYSGCRYTLQNTSGMVVAVGELIDTDEEQVDMSGMQSGSYVLHVEKDGASYPFKIQKK